jgi:hypothetical protein
MLSNIHCLLARTSRSNTIKTKDEIKLLFKFACDQNSRFETGLTSFKEAIDVLKRTYDHDQLKLNFPSARAAKFLAKCYLKFNRLTIARMLSSCF